MSFMDQTSPDRTPSHSAEVILETVQLTKSFGRQRVLVDVTMSIGRGECLALTGSNGAGKTTLLRCWIALTRPSSGIINWFGHSAPLSASLKGRLGFVGHGSRLYPDLSARENLLFAARMLVVPDASGRIESWLEEAGLGFHADKKPHQLSRGLRQRLSVARAMIHTPQLLVLDEPFTGLDREGAGWLCARLRTAVRKGQSVVFTTHESKWIEELASRHLHLESGTLREVQPSQRRDATRSVTEPWNRSFQRAA